MTAWVTTAVGAAILVAPWWLLCRRRPDIGVLVVLALAVYSSHVFAVLYQAGVPDEIVRGLVPIKDVLAVTLAASVLGRVVGDRLVMRGTSLVVIAVLAGVIVAFAQQPQASRGVGEALIEPADGTRLATLWRDVTQAPYAAPQPSASIEPGGVRLTWTQVGADESAALQGLWASDFGWTCPPGEGLRLQAAVRASEAAATWRVAVAFHGGSDWVTPDGSERIASVVVPCTEPIPLIGIEVLRPEGGWQTAGSHLVTSLTVTATDPNTLSAASEILRAARGLAVPVIALVTGLALGGRETWIVMRAGSVIVLVGGLLGLVELLLPLSFLTDVIGVGAYWEEVKQVPQFLIPTAEGLVPGNTFVQGWNATSPRRLAGPFGDSLSAGYVLAAGLMMAVSGWSGRRRVVIAGGIAVCLILTFTRAGWLLGVAGALPVLLRPRAPKDARTWAVLGLAGVGAVLILIRPVTFYVQTLVRGNHGSTEAHLSYLSQLADLPFTPGGSGLGQAGAIAGVSTESSLATVTLQLGLVLGLLYWAGTGLLVWSARGRWSSGRAWAVAMAALAVTLVVSEQWLTFNAGWPLALVLALGVRFASGHSKEPPDDGSTVRTEDQDLAQRQGAADNSH